MGVEVPVVRERGRLVPVRRAERAGIGDSLLSPGKLRIDDYDAVGAFFHRALARGSAAGRIVAVLAAAHAVNQVERRKFAALPALDLQPVRAVARHLGRVAREAVALVLVFHRERAVLAAGAQIDVENQVPLAHGSTPPAPAPPPPARAAAGGGWGRRGCDGPGTGPFQGATSTRQLLLPMAWPRANCGCLGVRRLIAPPMSSDAPGSPTGS